MSVQPGVESFSTNILKSMRKMTTGMRNVELIKWCTYYGINCLYNILMRFPGETAEDYRMQSESGAEDHPLPAAVGHREGARRPRLAHVYGSGIAIASRRLTPAALLRLHLSARRIRSSRVSYYFDHEMTATVPDQEYDELFARVAVWQDRWAVRANRPFLRYRKAWSSIVIDDGRSRPVRQWRFSDGCADLYEFCADARTLQQLHRQFGAEPWMEAALAEFLSLDLMLLLDGRYLSLALPENPDFDLSLDVAAPSTPLGTGNIPEREDHLVRIV